MSFKQSVLHIHMVVKEGVDENGEIVKYLGFSDDGHKAKFENFLSKLTENQIVDCFYDANVDDGTLAQLAKIHACIRQLSVDTGDDFESLKITIKKMSGLCVIKDIDGDQYMVCKSLSKCSKDELGAVIKTIIEIGEKVGINFY